MAERLEAHYAAFPSSSGTGDGSNPFTDFSGDVVVDEWDEGPCCILSAVDHRRYTRLLDEVLDHKPTHDDIRGVLGRVQTALAVRDLRRQGITTDGSPRSPVPIGIWSCSITCARQHARR